MKRHGWKTCAAAVMAGLMLMVSACSKNVTVRLTTGLSAGELFRIENLSCTEGEAKLFLMNQKNLCEAVYGRNIWNFAVEAGSFDDYMVGQLQDFLTQLKGMVLMAKERDLTLSEEEKQAASDAAAAYLAGLGEEEEAYVSLTQEELAALYEEYRLAELLVQEVTEEIHLEISDDEARVMEIQEIILHKTGTDEDGNPISLTDREIAALRSKAQDAAEQAASGVSFTSLQESCSQEASGSIRITRGDVPAEWEDAVFDLTNGQVSQVLENEDRICVIYCVNHYLEPETEENKQVLLEKVRAEGFYQEYDAFAEGLAFQYNEEQWNALTFADSEIPDTAVNFYEIYEQYFE